MHEHFVVNAFDVMSMRMYTYLNEFLPSGKRLLVRRDIFLCGTLLVRLHDSNMQDIHICVRIYIGVNVAYKYTYI